MLVREVVIEAQNKINNSEELFLGLVGALGSDLEELSKVISNQLLEFGYATQIIRLTDILPVIFKEKIKKAPEYDRISSYMNYGDEARKRSNLNPILAMYAISRVSQCRKTQPTQRKAYIFHSLKHPEEVKLLRNIYGESFYLIGLHGTIEKRLSKLVGLKNIIKDKAEELILRDKEEIPPYGQKVRKTYQLSDVFINGDQRNEMISQSKRFIELLFGFPYHTPNPQEHNMFQAYAASLRSSDLSRQVGAIIVNKEGDIVAQGANDVPKFQGGLYNNDDKLDVRDFQQGYDSNYFQRNKMVQSIVEKIRSSNNKNDFDQEQVMIQVLKEKLKNIKEYGRAVHAEMEALLATARVGISVRGGSLYTTTYPCHNCAKHIVAAGIIKVIYVEPYPKSLAGELHKDSISIDKEDNDRVSFLPFLGVGPRRYFDLFSLKLSSGREVYRKDEKGFIIDFESSKKSISLKLHKKSNTYIDEEKASINVFERYLKKESNGGKNN